VAARGASASSPAMARASGGQRSGLGAPVGSRDARSEVGWGSGWLGEALDGEAGGNGGSAPSPARWRANGGQ